MKRSPEAELRGVIAFRLELDCPELSDRQLSDFTQSGPNYVTRYLNKEDFEKVKAGSISFGTTYFFRKKENLKGAAERLKDTVDGSYREFLYERNGDYKSLKIKGLECISDVDIKCLSGPYKNNAHIEVNITNNDYCLCTSCGKYNRFILKSFRKKGSYDLKYYVTFDRKKLLDSINLYINSICSDLILLNNVISYKKVSSHLEINSEYNYDLSNKVLSELWYRSVFFKPSRFKYENEYRLIIVNKNKPGKVPLDAKPLDIIGNENVRESIFDSGQVYW